MRQRNFCCAMTAGAWMMPVAPAATAPAVATKLRRFITSPSLKRPDLRAIIPRRRRKTRPIRSKLFRPHDDLLAILPLEHHHLVRNLEAVRVHLERAVNCIAFE